MTTFVIILHVIACLCLIFIVLLQTGKGSEIGAIFGSASSSVFGPTGPTTILTKITIISAIVFMITSFYLTYSFSKPLSNTIVPKSKTTEQGKPQPSAQPPIQQQQKK